MRYSNVKGFNGVYLEDSFVLSITETDNSISFYCEFVLTEENEFYTEPKVNEQYCYKKGTIIFINIYSKSWDKKVVSSQFKDANEEVDLGNIDVFDINFSKYILEGDWGRVQIVTDTPPVLKLDDNE